MNTTDKGDGVDFAAEWANNQGHHSERGAALLQRMYSLGLAAASKPVDSPDFAAIRERCERASASPWRQGGAGIAEWSKGAHVVDFGVPPKAPFAVCYGDDIAANESNADFIAHARTDIPLLLDALAAAQASQAAAYRAALEAASEVVYGWHEPTSPITNIPMFQRAISQAILALETPEKWGGGK